MKKRPILFSGEMVRAILNGCETMTRRIVKVQPENVVQDSFGRFGTDNGYNFTGYIECPYGQSGDRLWIKETFYAWGRWVTRFNAAKGRDEWHFIDLTQSGKQYQYNQPEGFQKQQRGGVLPTWWKRPSIFMPRVASRITLEITGVRVERLQDISEADAKAEGIEAWPYGAEEEFLAFECDRTQPAFATREQMAKSLAYGSARAAFRELWDSINGERASWEPNPWVWVIEFKRVEGER